jgi:hypothetical protein
VNHHLHAAFIGPLDENGENPFPSTRRPHSITWRLFQAIGIHFLGQQRHACWQIQVKTKVGKDPGWIQIDLADTFGANLSSTRPDLPG